ncbi:MAG: hypothetical protein ACREBW_06995, partial [Candidatus Micrarchaeaceae archaeon]
SLHAKMQAFSPLEVRYVCMATDSPYGDDVAYSLYMLTRHKLPGRLEYLPYVRRGLPDIGFRVAKSADLQHNTVDPRPITSEAVALKVAEKNVLYEAAKLLVRDESSASTPLQDANVPQNDGRTAIPSPPWEARYHELITATSSEQLPGMVAALGTYIYGAGLPAHWLHTA